MNIKRATYPNWEMLVKTVEVTIPEIEAMRLSHYLTIGSECSNSIAGYLEKLWVHASDKDDANFIFCFLIWLVKYIEWNRNKAEVGWDVRVGLAVYGSFHSHEYLNAQKIRHSFIHLLIQYNSTSTLKLLTVFRWLHEAHIFSVSFCFPHRRRQLRFHEKILSIADVIVTPTVGYKTHLEKQNTHICFLFFSCKDLVTTCCLISHDSVTAYTIEDDALKTGELDYINGGTTILLKFENKLLILWCLMPWNLIFFLSAALVRYQIAGNFLGFPAVTIPVMLPNLYASMPKKKFNFNHWKKIIKIKFHECRLDMINLVCQ